jgi:hypothetical protein
MIKLGVDIGESKTWAEIWSSTDSKNELQSTRSWNLIPSCVYFESLCGELIDFFSPEELSFKVGLEALQAFQEENVQRKIRSQKAWFIPSIKRLFYSKFSGSRLCLDQIAGEMKKHLNLDLNEEKELFTAVPLQANFYYREMLKNFFLDLGLDIKQTYDEPLCLLSSSGLLTQQEPFHGKAVTIDYGCRNLNVASFIVDFTPDHTCEIVLRDYLVEPGVGGDFLDHEIFIDVCRRNPALEIENIFEECCYLCLIREKRESLVDKERSSGKWQISPHQTLQYDLSLESLQNLTDDLFNQAAMKLEEFLNKGINKNSDVIIVSGGVFFYLKMKDYLERLVDPRKIRWMNSRGAVAQGALQLGVNLDSELSYRKDLSIGVGFASGRFLPLIELSKLPQDEGEELHYKRIFDLKAENLPREGVEVYAFLGLSECNSGNIPLARQILTRNETTDTLPLSLIFSISVKKERGRYSGSMRVSPRNKVLDREEEEKFIFYV